MKLIRNAIGEIENEALAGGRISTPDLLKSALNERLKAWPVNELFKEKKVTLKKYFDIYINEVPNRVNRKGHKLSKSMVTQYGTIKKFKIFFQPLVQINSILVNIQINVFVHDAFAEPFNEDAI